jgi:high affinity Mn2+ porin
MLGLASAARAADDSSPAAPSPAPAVETWAVHGQATFTEQANAGFRSPFEGPNSLPPFPEGRETFDATLFLGFHPWAGGEVWINPEVDQGFGLGGTLGLAGFASGEAYKVGAAAPYAKLQRAFLRQTIDLGGETQKLDAAANQLAGAEAADRLVLTVGKFSVVDIFDTNAYAHDPRGDFLNWTVIDAGAFDYAANAWGYTYGAAAELYEGRWVARAGLFDLSIIPNSVALDPTFRQFQLVGELEEDHEIGGQPGAVKVTGYLTRGRMGAFGDAIRLAAAEGGPADIVAVRHYNGRPGVSLDVQQQLAPGVGVFLRAGLADGHLEPFNFTDVDKTVSAGVSLSGSRWGRPDDVLALAGVANGISSIHRAFLNDGGLGILIGDGALPEARPEEIVETYYDVAVAPGLRLTADYQFVDNPAYNRQRGPVSIGALRLHTEF